MPPFQSLLNPLRPPALLSIFGLTRSYTTQPQAQCTHFLPRHPSPAATRESPFPLVFLRTPGLSPSGSQETETWKDWSGMFAEKGYTAIEIDIAPPPYSPKPFAMMVGALASQIRLLAIPFPPVIVAEGRACLLSQSYIEDNPASGIVLIDPPGKDDPRTGKSQEEWEWPAFGYEPHFPILVVNEQGTEVEERFAKAAESGIGRGGKGISLVTLIDGSRGEKSRVEVERWMDQCGF